VVQSVIIYGAEAWDVNRNIKNKHLTAEMDYPRRNCGRTRLQRRRKKHGGVGKEHHRQGAEMIFNVFWTS
jgi:hypothetical protein